MNFKSNEQTRLAQAGFPWAAMIDALSFGVALPIAALGVLEWFSPLRPEMFNGPWGKILSLVGPGYFEAPIHQRPLATAAVMLGLFVASRFVCAALRRQA